MPAPQLTVDLYAIDIATATNYATAGAATTRVKIDDCDRFSVTMIAGSSNAVDYKVQVNNLLDPLLLEASPGWSDFVAESTIAAGASESITYASPGFRWVRIIQQLDTTTDDVTMSIATLRDKPGY